MLLSQIQAQGTYQLPRHARRRVSHLLLHLEDKEKQVPGKEKRYLFYRCKCSWVAMSYSQLALIKRESRTKGLAILAYLVVLMDG